MDVFNESGETEESSADHCRVTMHQSSPERTVFTEKGNTDAWISTDLTISPER